ncbi:MAG: hypothetical protein FWF33_05475, partial [Clostridiales bacterium]|nr:hypothetical protein [Clostridiales bacterium]
MNILISVFYLITAALLFAHLFFLRKSEKRQNAVLWLAVCILFYECWLAFAGGILSLAHIPVTLVSVGICNLLACVALRWAARRSAPGEDLAEPKGDGSHGSLRASHENRPLLAPLLARLHRGFPLQAYTVRGIDIALAVCLGAVVFWLSWERFATDAPIIYATIDPVDRLSAAQHAMVADTVIYTYPNMFFGHMSNAMFMQLLDPVFHGIYTFRAFQIKESINFWLAGLLFYGALRQYSDKNFACGFFFALTFAYTLGYPWNNQLYGFGYLGASVTLIILVQIGAKLLFTEGVKPQFGLAVISAGCLGVGISYTLFAPPAYIAAFLAIALYFARQRRALMGEPKGEPKGDGSCGSPEARHRNRPLLAPLLAPLLKRVLLVEIAVFAIPV